MQLSLFDGKKEFKIDKPIRLIELFAGIGSQAKALKNLGVDFEHYRICEFDKYAVASYNAVHGTNFETSDITKITANDLGIVDTDKYCYIMTYSFPCQDLSNAGLGKGMAKGSGTRSGLLWEVERLLDKCNELPNVLIMENVPAVIGAKNIQHFAKWQEKLEQLGYKNKWEVLNAKDFGIPQNRERCFMVSILGDYYYEFPKTIPLKLRLKDMLEKEVDEKYYLSDSTINNLELHRIRHKEKGNGFGWKPTDGNGIANTLKTESGYRPDSNFIIEETNKCNCIGTLQGGKWDKMHDINKRVYLSNGLSPTITTCEGVRRELKIAIPSAVKKGYEYTSIGDSINISYPNSKTRRGRVGKGVSQTLLTDSEICVVESIANYRIRKLTPKECWRLMGFYDNDIDKSIAIGMSNAQLYKQAGNSIVVNVLMAIFSQMI